MLALLSHSRSARFASGCDPSVWMLGDGDHKRTELVLWLGGGSGGSCVGRAPKCRHSWGWWHKLLSEQSQAVRAVTSLQRSRWWEMGQSGGCVSVLGCLCWQTFVVWNPCCVLLMNELMWELFHLLSSCFCQSVSQVWFWLWSVTVSWLTVIECAPAAMI